MFSIVNALSPSLPLAGYTPPYTLTNGTGAGVAPTASDPLWLQILYGLQQANSILDPYIFTEQEMAQAELQRLQYLAEMEKARQAGIETQPRVPIWAWLLAGGAVVVVLVLLLRE